MGIEQIRALKGAAHLRKESPVIKPAKPLKKRGEKMKATMHVLKKLYPLFLKKRPLCVIKSPVCTQVATCVNHTQGRGPDEILDQSTWEPSCENCNNYIEQHHDWGFENGHKKSRHGKTADNK